MTSFYKRLLHYDNSGLSCHVLTYRNQKLYNNKFKNKNPEVQMKTQLKSVSKITTALFMSAILVFNSANVFAAGHNDSEKLERINKKKFLKNLENGIQSDNVGLKKSCIYYVGLYKLSKSVDFLVDQLDEEKDPDVRMLIALSLYKVGDEKGFKAIKTMAEKDENPSVRNLCKGICNEFTSIIDSRIAQINE